MKENETIEVYDFGINPIEVNTHFKNRLDRRYFTHLVKKPSNAQWLVWGHEIFEERRYLTTEEIEEKNEERKDDLIEGVMYEHFFDSFTASHRLYSEISISITEHLTGEDGEILEEETFAITPELLDRPIGSQVVIDTISRFHCFVDEDNNGLAENEIRVLQKVGEKVEPYLEESNGIFVSHILRKPNDEEKQLFQNEGTRIWTVLDKPNTHRISYNLRIPNDLYDEMLIRVENATLNGKSFTDATRLEFLSAINPVIKLWIIQEILEIRHLIYR